MVKSMVIELSIVHVHSLKEKRSIIKSIIHRIHNQYNVSIAEVGDHDFIKGSLLGIAVVSNESKHADKLLSSILNKIHEEFPVEIVDVDYGFE